MSEGNLAREPASRFSFSGPRIWFLGLSVVSLVVCAVGGVLHYTGRAPGNPAQLTGWLLSMLFFLLAFLPAPGEVAQRWRTLQSGKTAFVVFWILVFVAAHLWHFSTAPWNGNALFDESGWDLWYLKSYVIGHPYQAAWFHLSIARETLFHYYVWLFLSLFGYNILAYEAALFLLWCAIFVFTLLLTDLLFRSRIVTSLTALIFIFLPISYIYTFAGYRYPMAVALCVGSLYFLHLGFRTASSFSLALGGLTAGLCLASSISGKQYLITLLLFGLIYTGLHWRTAKANFKWAVPVIAYGWLAGAMTILCYIVFTREHYLLYESTFVRYFMDAWHGKPSRWDLAHYTTALWQCFFKVPGPRFFIPDALPIPLPYYCFLLPGLVLALRRKRYEIVFLAIIPIVGAFISTAWENRLLLAIPFWVILMGFTFAGLLHLKLRPTLKALILGVSALLVGAGLLPSLRYINEKGKGPWTIRVYAQEEVAVSRFLKNVVAGREPPNPPRLEHNEFNRISGIPDAPYETLICQQVAYSILHLFLHDYDDVKIMSLCGDLPDFVQTEQEVWNANRKALVAYVPMGRDLKLIWERDPRTQNIIKMFEPFRDLGKEESLSYIFEGRAKVFYVLNIESKNIRPLQERVRALPDSITR